MGSQTLEILRQVWASLTGGYYFDPQSGVFCNVVHLYLWLFLFLFPFIVYLYFPGTWLTWCIYCLLTSATILSVKLINMALHRLYDRAQSMSDTNLKNQFFKITKETQPREDDTGIELKVMENNCSRGSVDNAIHEASDENSMLSIENINSIIDLKVDVHRKNSSESIELMFYPPSRGSQQDQHSIAGSASVSKSLRSNNTATGISTGDKYLTVYPEHENEISNQSQDEQQQSENVASNQSNATTIPSLSIRQPHLLRKSSEDFKRRHQQRRRLERQRSLETAPYSESISTRLMRNTSDSLAAVTRHETFLHPQQVIYQNNNTVSPKSTTAMTTTPSKTTSTTISTSTAISTLTSTSTITTNAQRLSMGSAGATLTTNSTVMPSTSSERRSARLQRHRSSETHDERLKQQNRGGIYLSIHHEHNHHHHHHHRSTSSASSIGGLANISSKLMHGNELNHSLAGALQSWLLGSSSDFYNEDDSCTKSDYGIEQLDDCATQQQQQLRNQQHLQQKNQKSQRFRHQRQGGIKRRRHSNATSSFKNCSSSNNASSGAMLLDDIDGIGDLALSCATPQTSVRRIKSTALEISCPRPSISNLSPHPNSVEAINGQQQIRNNNASLLPPPSKCLVRNPHLSTLCPKFGGSFGGSSACGNNLTFGVNTSSDSTLALIEPVYPIAETVDKKCNEKSSKHQKRQRRSHDNADHRRKEIENDCGDIDVLSIVETAMKIRNGHVDEDDDDAVDDVPVQRRRKALGCRQDRRSVESDVGEILADGEEDEYADVDVDEFKDFDDNLEHILQDLQHTQNQLDDLKAAYDQEIANIEENRAAIIEPIEQDKPIDEEDDFDEPIDSQVVMRERIHSTDSETDNKGSRSPLLNNKKYNTLDATAREADKALRKDIIALQQKHKNTPTVKQKPPQLLHACGEGDSGCPSSDCEQISASSKDMLLSGIDASQCDVNKSKLSEIPINAKSSKETEECDEDHDVDVESDMKHCETNPKQLGAIPKIIKYREVDEMNIGRIEGPSTSNNITQLHRRRGGGNANNKNNSSGTIRTQGNSNLDDRSLNSVNSTKPISRTSSSTSSCSLNAYPVSNDMQKMLWFMHGGALDERGRPIAGESTTLTPNSSMPPPNMSVTQFQMYQDAIQALNASAVQAVNCSDRNSLSDQRQHGREKVRRCSKQISEPTYNNASYIDFPQHHHHHHHHHTIEHQTAGQQHNNRLLIDGNGAPLSCDSGSGRASIHRHSPFGVVVTTSALNSRNVSNAATLSMQGLFDAINEERNAVNQARGSSSGSGANVGSVGNAAATTLLNVDGHGHIENYCDYWRPACMLSTEKPIVPKSFYKYRLKCCGYEHDFKISMDRLELLALFDRDLHWLHVILSFILCAMVAYLGATILQHGYYKDLFALVFCAVIAGSQYSLIKSVQPDAASPIHGFNKTVAYSRAIYFCLCGGLLLVFENLKKKYQETPPSIFTFFGVEYSPEELNTWLLQIMYILLLCFPVIFSLGLFPQINTFLMYFLEQLDMHVFGGNAVGSLLGAFFCVVRSLLGVCLLYGPLYAALVDGRGTQYIVFSIFCAMLVPLGYHLSRSSSDLSHLWALIKNCIVSTYREDDDEFSASSSGISSQKLGIDTPKRRSKRSLEQECDNEHIEMSSIEKLASIDGPGDEVSSRHFNNNLERKRSKSKASSLASSSQTIAKTKSSNNKKLVTDSNSYISMEGAVAVNVGDCGIISKSDRDLVTNDGSTDMPHEGGDMAIQSSMIVKHPESHENDLCENDEIDDDKISTSSTTNPGDMSTLTAGGVGDINTVAEHGNKIDNESPDPLPKKLQTTVNTRLKNDLVVMTFLAIAVLGLHSSTVFTVLQPDLNIVLYVFTGVLGLTLHYIVPQMRKHMPWLCFSRPLLRQKEFGQFEVANAAKIMWFEKAYIYLCMVERNVLFPLLIISALTADAQSIVIKFGIVWGPLIVAVCALKFLRNAYSDPTNQYLIVIFTVLLFRVDFAISSESFLIDFFFVSIAYRKCCDFLLKLQFIVTYIAPWQITWGSAFHAFAQPFSVPHSAMLFLQAGVSAALSTPLNPFLGSAIFLTSYVRPIKFWERDYNTRRIDHSNTRLVSQLERDLGADDNNLNSIFYEHLTRSLQHSLCGDLLMGRWGNVNQGDCFVLASDYLNCLVHIIELGNGLCTFQMRGLEFRGTYCQQREVEAISEDVEDNDGCCCCDPGHLPRLLSANAMFSTRWLAWQVVAAQYVLEGYSISDNLASATLQVFEYRKVLITYYIKSIIYYVIKNVKLEQWLASGPLQDALQHTLNRQFVDLDPIFNHNLDEDFDFRAIGITRSSFCYIYLSWINFCYDKRKDHQNAAYTTPTQQHASNGAVSNNPNNNNNSNSNNNNNNDSKSTPNLSTATLTTAHTSKSQSQQQLRGKPQKSATMSSGAIVNNSSGDPIATSQSYANILRQTSESAPGLSGAGFGYPLTNNSETGALNQRLDSNSLNSSTTVAGGSGSGGDGGGAGGGIGNSTSLLRTPLCMTRGSSMKTPKTNDDNKSYQKETETSPLPMTAKEHERLGKPIIKLKVPTMAKDSPIVSLCLALSLLARRSLATASHGSLTGVEFFLHGLHALFKGDFRITSPRDEWVFADMELLHAVVAPAVKMALKLQQDHILNPDEFLEPQTLYEAIDSCAKDLVISHEADPVWRSAVLRGAPNLLALRHVMEDGSDEYRIIRLAKRFLSFRVIKLNRECVRGLWAGQQQELIYLRNRNPERGSIQNAKQALRNIINSSCDQPIGYPIYVSPLTTSYADTNEHLCKVIGGAITLESIRSTLLYWWQHIRERCRQGCSSGSAMGHAGESTELAPVYISPPIYNTLIVNNCIPSRTPTTGVGGSLSGQYGSDGLANSIRGSGLAVMPLKPTSTALFATLINREQEALRELRALRKSQTQGAHAVSIPMQRGERERRATLPIASTSLGVVDTGITTVGSNDAAQNYDVHLDMTATEGAVGNSSPRYTKFSSSSGSLGIGNIITTPGDYPRKTKGPICLAGISKDNSKLNGTPSAQRKPRFDINKKVIIVDGTEIYDCLDLGRRIDVTWPNEEMRLRGGHMSWKEWSPRVGMVGQIVHYWIPNHSDARFRSHVDRVVYLIEIGDHIVPVGEYGLREYNQIIGDELSATSSSMTTNSSRHSLMHYHQEIEEMKQQQQRENLAPISSSELETPMIRNSEKVKIQAVSSSSSEDDYDTGLLNFEMQKRGVLMNVWKMIAAEKQQKQNNLDKQQKEQQENISIESNENEKEKSNELNINEEQNEEYEPTMTVTTEDEVTTEHQQKEETENVETLKTKTTIYLTVIGKSIAEDNDKIETLDISDSSSKTTEDHDESVIVVDTIQNKYESNEINEDENEQQGDSQSNNEIII